MFRVSFTVDDEFLKSLLSGAKELKIESVPEQQLPGAFKFRTGTPKKKLPLSELKLAKTGTIVKPSEIKSWLPSIGWKPISVSYALLELARMGRIKKLKDGEYQVL